MAEELVQKKPGYIALVGVKPSYAEPGYGYIHLGNAAAWVGDEGNQRLAHTVDRFFEKPDVKTATAYVLSGDYLWNPTLIISEAGAFLERYREHAPEIYRELVRIQGALHKANEKPVLADAFDKMPSISIDNAILEKGGKMAVVPGNFGWRDIGDWRAIYDVRAKEEPSNERNVTRGNVVCIEGKGNLLCTADKKVLALIGVDDLVVIDTPDALLIVPRARAQHVKQVVAELKKRGLEKFV
ncbi:MAG: sugar phosphate nucleotidyltransferase [Patescibacteria group bacterium]